MERYRSADLYDGGRSRRDEGLRVTVDNDDYYRRRSPSPRDRFHTGDDSRRRDFSPRRNDYRDRGDQQWSGRQDGRNSFERRSRERSLPKRYSPSWRRQSAERSPPKGRTVPLKGRNFFQRSRSRSLSRGRHRSRSSSRTPTRGRGRYRSSPSPRRSPGHHTRRSSSYGERKRFKKTSSSSSRSGSRGRRSSDSDRNAKPKDDFFKSIYSQGEGEDSDHEGYLHPALNRGIQDAVVNKPNRLTPPAPRQEQEGAARVPNAASLAALSQAYGNSPQRKPYQMEEIDDEDRFLYGDDGGQVAESKTKRPEISVPPPELPMPPTPPQPAAESSQKPSGVTPGGFDSNALKNVLKAIGFDFEMSAQQSAAMQAPKLAPPAPVAQVPAVQQPQMQLQQVVEVPQPIQAMHSTPVPQMTQPTPPPVMVQPHPQHYYQPYDPYEQKTSQSFPQQPLQAGVVDTTVGYQVSAPNPSNPAGGYMVYQPVSSMAQHQVQALYSGPTLTSQALVQPQAQVQDARVAVQGGRVVLPPQREKIAAELSKPEKERLNRQERLNYLQHELEKLKRQQNELMRKKRKEKDGHKDPLIKKNNLLQAGVEEQIREIREAAERAAGIMSDSSESEEEKEESKKEEKYDFFDPGNHFCKLCHTISSDLGEFFSHLHSKSHRKAIDPYDRPWNENEAPKKKKSSDCISKAVKGSEFLIPITGYFCTLCQTFSGDQICAEDHCKSYLHNMIYKKHCKKNPTYEKKFKKKKKAAKAAVGNGKKVDMELQYVEKPAKKAKHAEKHVEKEPKYAEKEPKIMKEQRYPKRESEYPEKEPKFTEKPKKYEDEQIYMKKQAKYSDNEAKYAVERELKKENKHKVVKKDHERERYPRSESRGQERRDSKERPKHPEKRTFQEEKPEDKKPPRKYSGNYEQRVSADRGSRRKSRWSPGYDEYERNQQDSRRHTPEKKENREKHSRSRDRSEMWVERDIKEEQQKKAEELPKNHQQSIGAGIKIPTPGFGKFSWNSNATSHIRNSHFDQVPVDNEVSVSAHNDKSEDRSGKGKIAIKITGKSHLHPPRLSSTQSVMSRSQTSRFQDRKATAQMELQKKVEALKKENALRAQLSSVTLPAGRNAKQFQPSPNTAAVILGARGMGRGIPARQKNHPPPGMRITVPRRSTLGITSFSVKPSTMGPIGDQVFPRDPQPDHLLPTKDLKEPPPPGEEDIGVDEGDGANSDASGISMEIASDEE